MISPEIFKVILSKPAKNFSEAIRAEILRSGEKYQVSMYTEKQVFHSNHDFLGIKEFVDTHFGESFLHYTAWDGEFEYSARISKKGKVLSSRKKSEVASPEEKFVKGSFNRQKNYILREGDSIPALVDMGVFTKELKIAAPMRDKFHQINRFLELLADETNSLSPDTPVNIIDFGCGKSYLTFLMYHYFVVIKKLKANICGLDLDADIVKKCSDAAEKYGYDSLTFKQGDIGAMTAPPQENWGAVGTFNIVISLHACDTATDHALFNAIRWNADLICAVPCCQHELRSQMNAKSLKLFTEYGIVKERIASLATDAIRAKLLEACGYRSQIIEFTSLEHTQKNLFIRAKRPHPAKHQPLSGFIQITALEDIYCLTQEFSFEPTLLHLLLVHFYQEHCHFCDGKIQSS
ncbi:MAG: SAM-dependent methyltransferase [Defluviitaleaceae bacterium]|nr:SAM-dependent methyltransferase [Defluviitaleaceae bacterium]